jgi:glycosyltransferase involved in cell wall biosynthesis
MKKGHKEIVIFPVGPLNVRLELAKRIGWNHPHSSVIVLLRKDEKKIEPLSEEIPVRYRPLWKFPFSHLVKPGVIPIYHNAWHRTFLRMVGLAYLSGAFPISVYREDGQPAGEKALSLSLKELSFLFLSGTFYILGRMVRNLLPLFASLRRHDGPVEMAEKNLFILPIYPDLSHHFIFQQVLHLSRIVPCDIVAVVKGDSSYRAGYLETLDQSIRYLPRAEHLCMAALKSFCLLAFTRPRKLLEACLEIEQDAREEGENLWSVRGFFSPFNPLYGLALYGLSKGQIPGSVHSYGLTIPTNYAMMFSMVFAIPHTATYYIDIPKGIPSRFFRLKRNRLKKVIVHTRHCIQELENLTGIPQEKMTFIPFGTVLDKAVVTNGFRQPSELLAVGRLVPKKGFHILIEACGILRGRKQPVRCLIVGEGPELPFLKNRVKQGQMEETIIFLGGKRYDEYLSLLIPRRILVQPSIVTEDGDHDGVPSVILDAMARGLTVIGTSIGGIPEVIQDGENGFLVPPDDPEALANCIERLIRSPQVAHHIASAARSTILQFYDVKKLTQTMARECGFINRSEET